MYNFDKLPNRRNTNSCKWDECHEGELPMWVADMDFEALPEIKEAILKKANIGCYGYSIFNDDYFNSYKNFFKRRHNLDINIREMIYTSGIVPLISSSVRKLTTPGENVLIMAPVYNIFYNSILNNGRKVLSSDLVYENGVWNIDFLDLEKKMSNPQTSMMILCNPHNPVGRIWTSDELHKIGLLAVKYNVIVLSDEIHCDIISPGLEYVPFLNAAPEAKDLTIVGVAASKCFSIAGFTASAAIIPNEFLRHKVWRQVNTDEVGENNFFGVEATIAAFDNGDLWLDEMNEYVYENKKVFIDYINKNEPRIKIDLNDATYLLWADFKEIDENASNIQEFLREQHLLYLNKGEVYGASFKNYLRINLGTSRENVLLGAKRLVEGIKLYCKR